jgi:hypothetical protein
MRVVHYALTLTLLLSFGAQAAETEKPADKSMADNVAAQAPEKTGEATVDKILGPSEVSEQMAETWCGKLAECTTSQEMGPKECRKVLKKSFQEGFKNVPEGLRIEVKSSGLSQCSENIKKNSCDSLKAAQTLPGCEFISQLNRS